MIIRYADQAREVEIAATEQELLELSEKLKEGNLQVESNAKGYDVHPYSRFLSEIQVRIIPGHLVEFQVIQQEKLFIQGDYQKISILAEEILEFAKDCNQGEHIHIEYFDSHFYLSPNSVPVVIVHL
jgi:hypothetical protein